MAKQLKLSTPVIKEIFDVCSFSAEGKRFEYPTKEAACTASEQIDRRILCDCILDICESKKFKVERKLVYDDSLKEYRSGRYLFIAEVKMPMAYLDFKLPTLIEFLDSVIDNLKRLKPYGFQDLVIDIDAALDLINSFILKYKYHDR